MSELRDSVEAILFTVGRRIDLQEMSKLCNTQHFDDIKSALLEIKEDYDKRDSPIFLLQDGDTWKLSVRDKHLPIVHSLVNETDLSKSLMETLAVIAWKYPVLQADVIHIRTNKAYEHLLQLEEIGFIKRINFGRTKKITLTDKFFTYFDLPSKEQAQEAFKNVLPQELKDKITHVEEEIVATEAVIEESKRKKELESSKISKDPEQQTLEASARSSDEHSDEKDASTEEVEKEIDDEYDKQHPDAVEVLNFEKPSHNHNSEPEDSDESEDLHKKKKDKKQSFTSDIDPILEGESDNDSNESDDKQSDN